MKSTSFSMPDEMHDKITTFLSGTESISQFCFKAAEEKIKRMEVRDKAARMQLLLKDTDTMREIVKAVLKEEGLIK